MAAVDDVDEVANDCACGRGNDADTMRECRKGFFCGGIEEATRFEALPELLKGDLKRAGAYGLKEFGDELHLSALLVDGDLAANQNVEAVGGLEAKERGLLAEEYGGQLRIAVLDGEVDVAGWRWAKVGDFAFDPDVAVFALNVQSHFADQVADLPDVARNGGGRGLEGEAKLVSGLLLRAGRRVHNC